VHSIIDYPSPKTEHRHRHSPEIIRKVVEVLGEDDENAKRDIRREAWLHLLMDWGVLQKKDWASQRGPLGTDLALDR
jgi:hypothetical protein